MMHTQSLRFRMIALFCVVVGALVAGTYVLIYSVFAREIASQLDRRLLHTADPIIADLKANPDEGDIFTLDLPTQYLELLTPAGKVLQTSRSLQGHPLSLGGEPLVTPEITYRTVTDSTKGRLRLVFIPFRMSSDNVVLAFGESTAETDLAISNFRRTLLLLGMVSLFFTGAISAWYVGRSLRPVVELTEHAAHLTEMLTHTPKQELQIPVPIHNAGDELGKLAITFNALFIKVNAALGQLHQFVSDASHELRTPLAVLQGETELLLLEPRSPDDYQSTLRVIDSELKKLGRIVDSLFTLSMADAGQLRLAEAPIHLNEVLEEACAIATPLANAKQIHINCDPLETPYRGDEVFLRQLFLIFLENAVKYSATNTNIDVRLTNGKGYYEVAFKDQGVGIAPEHVPHIFKRFYRASSMGEARSGGLGLAIAQAITSSLGGRIECVSQPGRGSTFKVMIPTQAT